MIDHEINVVFQKVHYSSHITHACACGLYTYVQEYQGACEPVHVCVCEYVCIPVYDTVFMCACVGACVCVNA